MTSNELREKFLTFFQEKDHRIVKSSPLLPHDDPTLLFTNAGMVQFKRTFLGEEKRDYVRAATSQKCVRAGGKHNDLENVGRTGRHHTFFEMLGNFSFGDYFKEKAIELAWDLLINGYGLPVDKLWVSVFKEDDEAYQLWHKNIGVSEDRIVRLGEKDNFWSMGDTGPCGPCSEILIDQGESFSCGKPDCKVGCECDRYLELWNLVFMQFNRDESGEMKPLPRPSIDTGMGLERIAAVTQGGATNYDTDLFQPIIGAVEELSGQAYGREKKSDISIKVVADHSRAAAFLIGDGILPSNEGRGYVLRRILRRAIRHGRSLGMTRPFLHKTSHAVMRVMSGAYPELLDASAYIQKVIINEEERFIGTLDHGLKVLDETLQELKARGGTQVPGDVIFKLYDTYGFPVDIVQDVVRDDGITLDTEGFQAAMEHQRSRSRTSWKGTGQWSTKAYKALSGRGVKIGFEGYKALQCDSEVLLLVKNGNEVTGVDEGDIVELVAAATPFYGEAGGQAGDQGIITDENSKIEVLETLKDPAGIIIHKGKVVSGSIKKGDIVTLSVDEENRAATALNHTATHILHTVLKRVLGDHVKQAGSLVAPDRFRFDFIHFSALDDETILKIETLVNEEIRRNTPLTVDEMDAEAAQKTGAIALFEEKYGDRVRVVSIGDFSKELCGGTHTKRTGDIGIFKILSESSVAAGIRRIEAITGKAALGYVLETATTLTNLARMLKARPEDLKDRIDKLIAQQKSLEKEIEAIKARELSQELDRFAEALKTVNGIPVLAKVVAAETPSALRDLADRAKDRIKSGVIVLGSAVNSKALLVAVVTKDHLNRYHAGNIIKKIAPIVGGSGGGRPDMAQAGGSKPEQLSDALNKVYQLIAEG
ncbi:MAG: alanine--tRNA ligase [Pseudomonadota bacterium]